MALSLNPKPLLFSIFLFLLPYANSQTFKFSNFQSNTQNLNFMGDAVSYNGYLHLTGSLDNGNPTSSVGRVLYKNPVRLWDASTGSLSDFTTHFSFQIRALNSSVSGDGLTFYLAPFNNSYTIPRNSSSGYLGLFNPETSFSTSENHIVAVEFDSVRNDWDPSLDHMGINIDSIVSAENVSLSGSFKDGLIKDACITYNSTTKNLSVVYATNNPAFSRNSSLSRVIDLRQFLPEYISVGFSAATENSERHTIMSWEFSSSSEIDPKRGIPPNNKKKKSGLELGLIIGACSVIGGLGLVWYFLRKRRRVGKLKDVEVYDPSMDAEFERGSGPKKFSFRELAGATNNFAEEGKLGEGGFGGVYKGFLESMNINVAVKKVSRGSRQGKKEYKSEVKIISRLRHKNLVQLIGWCHERSELLLVYELLPNGSLDSHLFRGKSILSWEVRHNIALGLASALLYLHEGWEQCVVHRDIKCSNIMLDSNFNTMLGDFGLARFGDHEHGLEATGLAGTLGYMAPEYINTGKPSKESDIFSFGVVALEIACGIRVVEAAKEEPYQVTQLVAWVWDMYGSGKLLDAADKRLCGVFDEKQMKQMIVLGLWCAHPDHRLRPSIKQAVQVLNFEAAMPNLPAQMPVPMFTVPAAAPVTRSLVPSITFSSLNVGR